MLTPDKESCSTGRSMHHGFGPGDKAGQSTHPHSLGYTHFPTLLHPLSLHGLKTRHSLARTMKSQGTVFKLGVKLYRNTRACLYGLLHA